MSQFGGKDSKRHFTVVMGNKEHGLYVSSTPSSAAKKAVTKLCAANKSKKVEFSIREITQGSKKKTYGPYEGYIEKLKEPIELKGRVIRYKPVAKLSRKSGAKKGGMNRKFDGVAAAGPADENTNNSNNNSPWEKSDGAAAAGPAHENTNNSHGDKKERIAHIRYRPYEFQNTDDLNKKIEELHELNNNVFYILTGNSDYPRDIFILFNKLSKVKNKKEFKNHLNKMIEILKYYKNLKYDDFDYLNIHFFEPNKPGESHFSPEHNEILRYLAYKINPIAQNVEYQHFPVLYQHFPVLIPAYN
jgi:hypothetical protein